MAIKHIQLFEDFQIPRWSTGYWGSRFFGITGGILNDMLAEGAATALQAIWCVPYSPTSLFNETPAGGIVAQAADALLSPFPGEDAHAGLSVRVKDKWTFWSGSPLAGMIQTLQGSSGWSIDVTFPGDYVEPIDDRDYWSRFWVEHTGSGVTGPSPTVGASPVGDSLIIGPAGVSRFARLKADIRRYRPADWVCWDQLFRVGSRQFRVMHHPRIDNAFSETRDIDPLTLLGGAAAWFNPALANPGNWADANGSSVDFLQASGGNQPTRVDNKIVFDGVDDFMAATSEAILEPTSSFYWGARVLPGAATGSSEYLWFHTNRFHVSQSTAGLTVLIYSSNLSTSSRTYPALPDGIEATVEVFYDSSLASADRLTVRYDGVAQTAIASSGNLPAELSSATGGAVGLAAASGGGSPSEYSFGNILFYPDPFEGWLGSRLHSEIFSLLV